MAELAGKHILIIVENLPLPFDRRVWQEANALKGNGARVSIICPKMKGFTKSYECINGIEIYRHPFPVEANGALGYLLEYGSAIFWELVYSLRVFVKCRFHVIQGCNPPDLIFLVALFFKPFGVKYIFDHHDINPELYVSKYQKKDFFYRLMVLFEKLTFKTANYSIATNESFKEIAMQRGGMAEDHVQVIRSGPSLQRIKLKEGNPIYKKNKKYLVGYIGIIGDQDGLDLLMHIIEQISKKRNDVHFAIIGGGTELENVKNLAIRLGITEVVDFHGLVFDDNLLLDILNTCDIGVAPDKPIEMNHLSTMNKVMEYMALKKPVVQFDLKEGRASAKEASLYAENNNLTDFADKIMWLLDHEAERKRMGEFGYNRVVNELSWEHEGKRLNKFYEKILKSR